MDTYDILIVDDHPVVGMAMQVMLRDHSRVGEIHVFDRVRIANRFLAEHPRPQRCLVILDIDMPTVSGLDMLRLMPKGTHRSVMVLVYTSLKDIGTEVAAVRAGASGFVTKDVGPEGFMHAFNTICERRSFFSDEALKIAVSEFKNPDQKKAAALTPREYLIAKRLSLGESPQQIGESLYISAKTVSSHKQNILEKLEIENIAQLINIFHHLR